MGKRKFYVDERQKDETLMFFSRCYGHRDVYVLQKEDGSFIVRGKGVLYPTEEKINPKKLRNGCLVKVVNPYNDFYNKKLIVHDIEGEMVTLLTHKGKMMVSAGTLKVEK